LEFKLQLALEFMLQLAGIDDVEPDYLATLHRNGRRCEAHIVIHGHLDRPRHFLRIARLANFCTLAVLCRMAMTGMARCMVVLRCNWHGKQRRARQCRR